MKQADAWKSNSSPDSNIDLGALLTCLLNHLVLLSLLCSLSFWQSAHIKETFLKKLASCHCVSTGSLPFESVSLLYSLTPPRWVPIALGSSSWHYDRGKTSAVTPPSVVLTETTDIIDWHTCWVRQHTHAYNTISKCPSFSYASKHTQLFPLLLATLLPLSLFRQPASISRSPVSLVILSLLVPHEVALASFSPPALQTSPVP